MEIQVPSIVDIKVLFMVSNIPSNFLFTFYTSISLGIFILEQVLGSEVILEVTVTFYCYIYTLGDAVTQHFQHLSTT